MTPTIRLARYAAIFAADAGTDALYYGDRITDDVAWLSLAVAQEAIERSDAAEAAGKDFYAQLFVEGAALALARFPSCTLEQLFEAGQLDVDSIIGGF